MSRTNDDSNLILKINKIVEEELPEFASRFFKHHKGQMTTKSLYGYAMDLSSFFGYLQWDLWTDLNMRKMSLRELNQISPDIIENYLAHSGTYTLNGVEKERSLSSLARRYSVLSSFFNYYYLLDQIDNNPVSKVARPKPFINRTPIPSNETNFKMLDIVSNGDLGGNKSRYQKHTKERDLAILLLILGAGINPGDVVKLNIDDLHLDENFITVRKRNKQRTVFVSDTISQAISRYLEKRLTVMPFNGDEAALFLSLQCKRICVRSIENMVKKYSSAMYEGKDHLTPYALKMSFRNNVFGSTMDAKITSTAAGNANKTVLLRYRAMIDEYACQKGREFSADL